MGQSEIEQLVHNSLEKKVLSAKRIYAGRNSKVYKILCESGETYAVKFYTQLTADGLSRLDQEWAAISFMTQNRIKNIPVPVAIDSSKQAAIYSFINGTPVDKIKNNDIHEVLTFLKELKTSSTTGKALNISSAAEACFSPAEVVENINKRFNILTAIPEEDELFREMRLFLEKDFSEELEKSTTFAKNQLGIETWNSPLPDKLRTLSPSDLGFHNALRTSHNNLYFVDFEYFGWDDPVKTASDFLLHPAMNLTKTDIKIFYYGMNEIFRNDKNFEIRFKSLLPLFRLKWCLILLNEFSNKNLKRRAFASGTPDNVQNLRKAQLEKAKLFLAKDKKILNTLFETY
ncbi:hypothetical protein [Maridesulfovibrio ferrireducens]|uniref:hypothetical protein n=1 Tax=Maridesulfovibrio ferrireducens TaxID=246191 RepID=UPI001A327EFE|nr:hypothetical protein [Maridesulfovibrio ferrireducens]MBI9109615.1 hypothetical protein [Maridesulfovibrio ferrireducens]